MPDREKVIIGLECWTNPNPYINTVDCMLKNCPYAGNDHCDLEIFNGALELLKAQEPRVLTLKEVITAKKLDVWFEGKGYNIVHPLMLIETEMTNKSQAAFFYPMLVRPIKAYGKTWRCWTSRPTDEQRKAVKWDAKWEESDDSN